PVLDVRSHPLVCRAIRAIRANGLALRLVSRASRASRGYRGGGQVTLPRVREVLEAVALARLWLPLVVKVGGVVDVGRRDLVTSGHRRQRPVGALRRLPQRIEPLVTPGGLLELAEADDQLLARDHLDLGLPLVNRADVVEQQQPLGKLVVRLPRGES